MTKLKVGDRFIPRKPKDTSQSPMWDRTMDKLDGCALTFARYKLDGTLLSKEYPFYAFHPGWCEKVEENSVNFVQREGDTISIEAPLSTSATATLGDVKKPFLIVTTNHHEGIKYEEGTAKSPYIPLIPLSPNHISDVGKTIDWEQRRWEAVMRLAASRLGRVILGDDSSYCKAEIKFTIDLADEMIKQLRNEEKARG